MANFTIRRDSPPAFMISPASMKKGTANSGKLLAPSIVFCARICGSNMFKCNISAAPHTSSENAMGTPSAMAPSSAPRKMAMVIVRASACGGVGIDRAVRAVFGFHDADQLARIEAAHGQLEKFDRDDRRRENGEQQRA